MSSYPTEAETRKNMPFLFLIFSYPRKKVG
uniref:Uncharacterized protein n=1 Tax=Arundo donax TaxID=35708 RepID=A0A0A9C948_ARUDO